MVTFANVIWGAQCRKSARWVLLGATRSRGHAHSVRRRRESAWTRQAPHGLPPSRLVSTIPFDLWADQWRRHHARGNVVFVRYADDTVAGFEYESDAKRFLADLRERLEKFALSLHPDKTRLIEFGRFAAERRARRGLGKPETFNFLGFTHICGVSRAGHFLLTRKTRRDRMRVKLRAIKGELWRRLHEPIREQGQWLGQVVRGYFAYHAVPTNSRSLGSFRHHVTDLWRRSLRRRSQRDRTTWERIAQLVAEFLPDARITHPWPHERFVVNHPRWKPGA
jgi:RNA-directed DNA polymerase